MNYRSRQTDRRRRRQRDRDRQTDRDRETDTQRGRQRFDKGKKVIVIGPRENMYDTKVRKKKRYKR